MVPRSRITSWLAVTLGAVLSNVCMQTTRGQTVSTWNGANGNWDAAANWSTNPFFPNNGNGAATYHAIIGAGTVNLNTDITLAAFTLNGGTLNGAGNLTTTDLTLNGGTLATTGTLSATHAVLSGGTLARNLALPAGSHTIFNVSIGAGSTLTNSPGGTLTATTGPGEGQSNGPGAFVNQGTFVKSGNLRYYLSIPTTNEGLIRVQQNNLRLTAPGTHTGTFEAVAGAQLELSGAQTLMPSASVLGPGDLLLIDGNVTIDSEVTTGVLRLLNSTLAGSGNLHPGKFNFESGMMARDLTLPAGNHDIFNVAISSGFKLTNPAGSTLTATTGPGEGQSNGPGTFLNQGTFVKSGNLRYYLSIPSTNEGLIQVQQNNLRLTMPGTHTGTFEALSGATLELAGAQTLMPTANVLGPGNLLLIDGNVTINSEVSSGVLRLLNSTLAGSGNLHPGKYLLESGTLARDLTLPTAATHDINSLAIVPGFTLTNPMGSELRALGGTVNGPGGFVNAGTLSKTGASTTTLNTFTNGPTGAVDVQQGTLAIAGVGTHDGTFTISPGATLRFGLLPTSTNTLTASSLVTGAGMLRVVTGTLNVTGDGDNDYTGGTTINFGGRVAIDGNGTALGTGAVTISSFGVLSIASYNNLLPAQAVVEGYGALAVRSELIPQALIAPSSAGTFAIDVSGFATPVNLAVLGDGSMALGSSTTGSYTATTLGPGAGNTYRVGGGGGSLTLTQANVLTGDRPLLVRGLGTIVLSQPQNFTQGTTLAGGTVAMADAGALGPGPITFQDGGLPAGGLRAEGGPIVLGNAVKLAGDATFSGQHDLTVTGTMTLTGNRTLIVTNTATTEIAGSISEDAAGRRLTIGGPGTLVLAAANSFTGGLTISGGTVIAAVDQTYQGGTAVDQQGVLILNADLKSSGALTVSGQGGTLTGEGTVSGPTSINGLVSALCVISPGDSAGTLRFAAGLTLGVSEFDWELGALTTTRGGFNWDRIDVTGGALNIQPGAILDIDFLDPDVAPADDEPFWDDTRRWSNIIRLTGSATNPSGTTNFLIDNTPYAGLGYFTTTPSTMGLGVDLMWTPGVHPGDLNVDGAVNMFDVNIVSSHWGEAGPTGDANGDGVVDIFDVNLISSNWTAQGGATSAAAAVPEPAGWLLAIAAAVVASMLRRRSRSV